LGKAEDRRAAIVAQQAARELAAREALGPAGKMPGRRRSNWAASQAAPGPRRGRPPRTPEG